MYIPKIFEKHNHQAVVDFLHKHSFGLLISEHEGKPWATHLPFEYRENPDGTAVLRGHIAKNNPQWKSFNGNQEVLAIFQGAHSYVSASWYSVEEVSTWNYTAIHIYGKLRIMAQEELMPMLEDLMAKYERYVEKPINMAALSKKTLNQVYGIVGFEITITEIQPKYKLSQNRSKEDYQNIINKLENSDIPGAKGVADAMRENAADRIK